MQNDLVAEWQKHDPFLLYLDEFQVFCDIRNAGSKYPMEPDDIFFTVNLYKENFRGCRSILRGSAWGTCTPKETPEAYWKRNNVAAETVKATVALHSKNDQTEWPQHLTTSHLDWIKDQFGIILTEKDFETAWELWEHKTWFSSNSGYYVRGWLAVADAMGIGAQARSILEQTPFPHADQPQHEDRICSQMKSCPIYQYKEWLKVTPIEIPDKIFRHSTFQSNCTYYLHSLSKEMFEANKKEAVTKIINRARVDFKTKWIIRNMIRDYLTIPLCRRCEEIAEFSYNIFSDAHKEELEKWKGVELCGNCEKLVHRAYETKVNPLRFQDKAGGSFGLIPYEKEKELRKKLIEGDEMFVGITLDSKD